MRRVRLIEKPARVRLEEPKAKRTRIRLTPDPTVNGDGEPPSLDLIARRVVMASVIYYGLGLSVVPDSVFDAWCLKLAKKWRKLDPFRQWQLGSAEEIKASGFHVKVTAASLFGAIAWMQEQNMTVQRVIHTKPWNYSKRRCVRYLYPEDFTW